MLLKSYSDRLTEAMIELHYRMLVFWRQGDYSPLIKIKTASKVAKEFNVKADDILNPKEVTI